MRIKAKQIKIEITLDEDEIFINKERYTTEVLHKSPLLVGSKIEYDASGRDHTITVSHNWWISGNAIDELESDIQETLLKYVKKFECLKQTITLPYGDDRDNYGWANDALGDDGAWQ